MNIFAKYAKSALLSLFFSFSFLPAVYSSIREVAVEGPADFGQTYRPFAGVQVTERGRDQLLKWAIKAAQKEIEGLLRGHEQEGFTFWAKAEDCTPDKLATMSEVERRLRCPGIPDYFFKDGKGFPHYDFNPRPTSAEVRDLRVLDFRWGEAVIECRENRCTISLPLENFDSSFYLALYQINESKRFGAGKKVLEFDDVRAHMGRNPRGELPSFNFEVIFNQGGEGVPFRIDQRGSQVRIPHESFRMEMEGGWQERPFYEMLNKDDVLSFSKRSVDWGLKFLGKIDPNLNLVGQFFRVDKSLSSLLSDQKRMGPFNEYLNQMGTQEWVRIQNQKIRESSFLSELGQRVFLKPLGIKQFLANALLHELKLIIERKIKEAHEAFKRGKHDYPLDEVEGATLREVIHSFTSSNGTLGGQYLTELQGALLSFQEELRAFRPQSDEEKEYLRKTQRLVGQLFQFSSLGAQHRVKDMEAEARANPSFLRLGMELTRAFPHTLSLVLDKSYPQGGVGPEALEAVGERARTCLRPGEDLSGFISLVALNQELRALFMARQMEMCFYHPEKRFCLFDQNIVKTVSLRDTPQFVFDPAEGGSYHMHLPIRIEEKLPEVKSREGNLKIALNVHLNDAKAVVVRQQYEADSEISDHVYEVIAHIGESVLSFLQNIHPLVDKGMERFLPPVGELRPMVTDEATAAGKIKGEISRVFPQRDDLQLIRIEKKPQAIEVFLKINDV